MSLFEWPTPTDSDKGPGGPDGPTTDETPARTGQYVLPVIPARNKSRALCGNAFMVVLLNVLALTKIDSNDRTWTRLFVNLLCSLVVMSPNIALIVTDRRPRSRSLANVWLYTAYTCALLIAVFVAYTVGSLPKQLAELTVAYLENRTKS
ncbi:hypothetical protein CAAN1_12S00210 [[Candida] anglica]|uniref:Uncharacterized protein n=1 Tax=[Candida] anglica TaxID=148631 RepID=A0ABP0EA92_9ASCO